MIAKLFRPEMSKSAYRADPALWQRMSHYFEGQPLPDSEVVLEGMLLSAFHEITGKSLFQRLPRGQDWIEVVSLGRGGMSEGKISQQFWTDVVFPELVDRFRTNKMTP